MMLGFADARCRGPTLERWLKIKKTPTACPKWRPYDSERYEFARVASETDEGGRGGRVQLGWMRQSGGDDSGGMWDLLPIGAGAGVWKGDEILESRHGAD